jgi:hypothetical protein
MICRFVYIDRYESYRPAMTMESGCCVPYSGRLYVELAAHSRSRPAPRSSHPCAGESHLPWQYPNPARSIGCNWMPKVHWTLILGSGQVYIIDQGTKCMQTSTMHNQVNELVTKKENKKVAEN